MTAYKPSKAMTPAPIKESALGSLEDSQLAPILRRVFPRIVEHQPVSLVYLYGSVTTGQTTPLSDIDFALVLDEGLSPLEMLRLVLRIQLDLADLADISNADVRIVNDAPLVLQGRVVSDGVLVYSRDEQERIEFETATRLRYFDYLPVHKSIQDAFFADLRERGLHG